MMPEKNLVKNLVHTLSINRKASNKQIAKSFGKFVRELVHQQRGCKYGFAYENMETFAECLQDEMDEVVHELATICGDFNGSNNDNGKAVEHFWNNIQGKGFTSHFLDGDKAAVITNDKTLQKNLDKVASFND
jgi:hypothetical protein